MLDEEQDEVFRGHWEECLRHLGNRVMTQAPKGSKKAASAKQPIADFCGVSVHTVTGWFYGRGSMPVGEQLIKVMCYLDLAGYKVIELERMPKIRRSFAEMIGFGLLTPQEATTFLDFSSASGVYRVLQGRAGLSQDKDQKLWGLWKERREELAAKKREAQDRYRLDVLEEKRIPTPIGQVPLTRKAAISIMEGLNILLEEGVFEKLSPSELKALRESGGDNIVLRLSARLSELSSRLIESVEGSSHGKG